jgi:hypothetical protein
MIKDSTKRRWNRALFPILIASCVTSVTASVGIVVSMPSGSAVAGVSFFLSIGVLLLGSSCLIVTAPTPGVRCLAIIAALLVPCSIVGALGIHPRSGESDLQGWLSTFGSCGSFWAAWACGLIAARRAYRLSLPKDVAGTMCRHCGYNLTGNESGICPECGLEVEQSGRPTDASR